MREERYAVNIYALVVFDINLDVTLCCLLAGRFSPVPAVFLVFILHFVNSSAQTGKGI